MTRIEHIGDATLYLGDCLHVLRSMPEASVDAVVTDPPYGLAFMGKKWDYDVPSLEIWAEGLRVLKPGGHLLAFAGTRTQHRMAVRIEDAGFEIRDMIAWVYGSGFPKSMDVSKAIDKAAGAEREKTPTTSMRTGSEVGAISKTVRCAVCGKARASGNPCTCARLEDIPSTEAARQWQGWGTALKPALEPITVARKPLGMTVAACVLAHGTGGINVDGCRVGSEARPVMARTETVVSATSMSGQSTGATSTGEVTTQGRWPANLIHDGSEEVLAEFPSPHGAGHANYKKARESYEASSYEVRGGELFRYGDNGSAARFFYCAKASKSDRDEGLDTAPKPFVQFQTANGTSGKPSSLSEGRNTEYRNTHPTVKPTELMRYLCRLVTPPGGTVLDPFMGSGSTGKAAVLEGFRFIGIEREAEYTEIAKARIGHAAAQPKQEALL